MSQVTLQGTAAFRYLEVTLNPGESIVTESGAMATMTPQVDLTTKLNGGLIKGLLRKFLGGESLFINSFSNNTDKPQRMTLTAPTPGDIREMKLGEGEVICLEGGSYICSTPQVSLGMRWAGIASLLAREGLFKLELRGPGSVWFGGYGAIQERAVDGEFIVDGGHLLAYDPQIRLKIQLANGIFGSFFGGEGLVTRVEGKGRIYLQTRSLSGLASWANPKL